MTNVEQVGEETFNTGPAFVYDYTSRSVADAWNFAFFGISTTGVLGTLGARTHSDASVLGEGDLSGRSYALLEETVARPPAPVPLPAGAALLLAALATLARVRRRARG